MFQVNQNYIVASSRDIVIEGDWPPHARMRVGEAFSATRPGSLECRHPKDSTIRSPWDGRSFQGRKAREFQRDLHRRAHIAWAEVEDLTSLDKAGVESGDSFVKFPLDW